MSAAKLAERIETAGARVRTESQIRAAFAYFTGALKTEIDNQMGLPRSFTKKRVVEAWERACEYGETDK